MSTYKTETKFNRESRYYPSLAAVLATHNAKVEHQPVAVIVFEDGYGKELAEWLFASVDEGGEMFDAMRSPGANDMPKYWSTITLSLHDWLGATTIDTIHRFPRTNQAA